MYMTIAQQLKLKLKNAPLVSVEFFPPKTEAGEKNFDIAAQELMGLKPEFVSVTCGAGGSTTGPTLRVSKQLCELGYNLVMPHCTCIGMSREDMARSIDEFVAQGFSHIMALRGDPPRGETAFQPAPDGFRYASELVAFLRERHPNLCLGVAGYPEKHPESLNFEKDIRCLKEKVDAGADFITTQLFLDNQVYFEFVKKCRTADIHVPILPGLLPVTSLKQINRMQTFCDFKVPEKLFHALKAVQNYPQKMERIGLCWAIEQIIELAKSGVPGIHLYLLNCAQTALNPELFACLSLIREN